MEEVVQSLSKNLFSRKILNNLFKSSSLKKIHSFPANATFLQLNICTKKVIDEMQWIRDDVNQKNGYIFFIIKLQLSKLKKKKRKKRKNKSLFQVSTKKDKENKERKLFHFHDGILHSLVFQNKSLGEKKLQKFIRNILNLQSGCT